MLSFVIVCYFSGIAIFVIILFSLVVAYLHFFDDEKSGAKVELSAVRTPLFLVFLCCTTYFLTYIILGFANKVGRWPPCPVLQHPNK